MAVITVWRELQLKAASIGMIHHGTAAAHQAVGVEVLLDRLHLAVLLVAVSNGRILFFKVTTERQSSVSSIIRRRCFYKKLQIGKNILQK